MGGSRYAGCVMPKFIDPHGSVARRHDPMRKRDSRAPSPETSYERTRLTGDLPTRPASTRPGPLRGRVASLPNGAEAWQPPDMGPLERHVRPAWKRLLSQAPDDGARMKLLAAWMRGADESLDVLQTSPGHPFALPMRVVMNTQILVTYAEHLHQRAQPSNDVRGPLMAALPDALHALGTAVLRFEEDGEAVRSRIPDIRQDVGSFAREANGVGLRIVELLGDMGAASDPALMRRMADLLLDSGPTPDNVSFRYAMSFFNAAMRNPAAGLVESEDFDHIMSRVLSDAAHPGKGIPLIGDDRLGPWLLEQTAESMRCQAMGAEDLSVDFHLAAHDLFQKFRGPGDDPRDPKYEPLCDVLAGTNEA